MSISFEKLKKAQAERKNNLDSIRNNRLESLIGSSDGDLVVRDNNALATTRNGLNNLRSSLVAKKEEINKTPSSSQKFEERFTKKVESYTAQIIKDVDEKLKSFSLELVFIIDKSSSCHDTESSTILGFEDLIKKEKEMGYTNTKVTVELFDKHAIAIYNRVPIENVHTFKYDADGDYTALYNCLGNSIIDIKNKHLEEGSPNKTLFVIMTDGEDNKSKQYSESEIRSLVEERQRAGWEFIFLGAMQTKKEVESYAASIGIPTNHSQLYLSQFVSKNFIAIETAINDLRNGGEIKPNWDKVIKDTLPPHLAIGGNNNGNMSIESNSDDCLRLEHRK